MEWIVLRCEGRKERLAAKGLQRLAQVYLPQFDRVIERRGAKPIRVPTPLFPGYIIVRMPLPPPYDRIRTVPGVMRSCPVLMLDGQPATLTPRDITTIAEAATEQGRIEEAKASPAVGARLEITNGLFEGKTADVIEANEDHITLLFTLLGRGVAVPIHPSQLRAGLN